MSESLFSPIQELKCEGKVVFNSSEVDAIFSVRQMPNGKLVGDIKSSSTTDDVMYNLFRSHESFQLIGKDDSGSTIVINNCYLTSIKRSFGTGASPEISGDFNCFEVIMNPEKLGDRPKRKVVAMFSLTNIDETFRVRVETRLGKLHLQHIKGYKKFLAAIKTFGFSRITAVANIFLEESNTDLTFGKILSESTDVIEGFLCIARLADTCYSDWCSVGIYEKMKDSDQYKLVFYKMSRPKRKRPVFRGITNPAHSSFFFESAYAGYKDRGTQLEDLYGFKIALEWYLEANIATVLESQYLMACTCLELLVDRYQARSRTEFIIDPGVFKNHLYPILKRIARENMEKLGMTSDQRREIYMKLKGLNRRSLRAGIESLICHLKVRYNDLFDDLGIIIRIRNELTHTGTYHDINELSKYFDGLYVLLTRIFLSILNYEQDYFDWVKSGWVHMKDVLEE